MHEPGRCRRVRVRGRGRGRGRGRARVTRCMSQAGAAGGREWKSGSTLKLHWYERLTTLSACSRLPPREG